MFSGAAQSRAVTPGEHTTMSFWRGPVTRGAHHHVFLTSAVTPGEHTTMSCFPARPSRAPSRQESTHHVMFSGAAQSRGGSHHHVMFSGAAQSREGPTSEGEDAGDQASSSGLLPRTVT